MPRPNITLAHAPVFGAIACTLFFNAQYAMLHAGPDEQLLAAIALSLTIDLAKATFLPAAARMAGERRHFAALLLVLLWFPALGYSTFAAYGYLASTRANANVIHEIDAGDRARAEADYRRAEADLATAKAHPDWQATGACTRPRTKTHRAFCKSLTETQANLDAAAARLGTTRPVHVMPEVAGLVAATGWPMATITLLIVLVPAVLIELLAGLGLYVLRRPPPAKAPQKPAEGVLMPAAGGVAEATQLAPSRPPAASGTTSNAPPALDASTTTKTTWPVKRP